MTKCLIKKVTSVESHPDVSATHINVIRTQDSQFVSMKLEDGSPRYKVGDLIVHIPDGALLDENLMKRLDVWDYENNKGKLKGSKGNKIKASNFRGFRSEGMLLPASEVGTLKEGDDASEMLKITF